MNIQRYMTRGVVRVVTDSLRATAKNEQESAFMRSFAKASRAASKKRYAAEKDGEHIPPFLIASITASCNLHCAGCYSRANNACCDAQPVDQMTAEEWDRIFREAEALGISFILLAGGEPMLRYDVLQEAAKHSGILFPIFTNGTYLHEKYLDFLDANRNLLPIISIEGGEAVTDARRRRLSQGHGRHAKHPRPRHDLRRFRDRDDGKHRRGLCGRVSGFTLRVRL